MIMTKMTINIFAVYIQNGIEYEEVKL